MTHLELEACTHNNVIDRLFWWLADYIWLREISVLGSRFDETHESKSFCLDRYRHSECWQYLPKKPKSQSGFPRCLRVTGKTTNTTIYWLLCRGLVALLLGTARATTLWTLELGSWSFWRIWHCSILAVFRKETSLGTVKERTAQQPPELAKFGVFNSC